MYNYTLGLYEKAMPDTLPLPEKLRVAKQTGYDFVELCVDLNPERAARLEWTTAERRALVADMQREGIACTTLSLSLLRSCPLGLLDDAENARALTMMHKAVELACDIGSRIILMNGYDVYSTPSTPQTTARFAENVKKAAAIAAASGVVLAIENAEMPFMDTVKKAADCVLQVNSPFFQVYGDIANTTNAMEGDAGRAVADLASGQGHLAAVHLKDSIPGEYRYTHYGKGHVNFPVCVGELKRQGVGVFTAELFHTPGEDYAQKAEEVCRFLRSFFK